MPYLLRAFASSCLFVAAACGGKVAAPATTGQPADPVSAVDAGASPCGACPDGQVCDSCPSDPTCPKCAVCGAPVCVPAP